MSEYQTAEQGGTVRRVTADDLMFAADWCGAYESDDPADLDAMRSVAAWLNREANRRWRTAARRALRAGRPIG